LPLLKFQPSYHWDGDTRGASDGQGIKHAWLRGDTSHPFKLSVTIFIQLHVALHRQLFMSLNKTNTSQAHEAACSSDLPCCRIKAMSSGTAQRCEGWISLSRLRYVTLH